MKAQFLFILFFIVQANYTKAQFLHFGLRTFNTPMQKIDFHEYEISNYVYYFSNEYNETIRFSGFESTNTKSYIPFPDLYIRFDKGNNLSFQADVFSTWFSNEAKYKNSVDYSDYAEVFNPNSELENLGYNSIRLKWFFIGNSFTTAYTFFKTKTLRPFIYGGISSYYLMSFKPGNFYQDTRSVRNGIIFNNLNSFKTVTFYYRTGAGFKYKGFSADVFMENNLGKIDMYEKSDKDDKYYSNRPNYKSLKSFNVSVSVNLLSFNLLKGQ
jgi:hypothetical protein